MANQYTFEGIQSALHSIIGVGSPELQNLDKKNQKTGAKVLMVIADDSTMARETLRDELTTKINALGGGSKSTELQHIPGSGFEALMIKDTNIVRDASAPSWDFAILFKNKSGRNAKPPTEYQEALVAYAMAMRHEKGKALKEDGSDIKQNWKNIKSKVRAFGPAKTKGSVKPLPLLDCIKELDNSWFISASLIANAWNKKYPGDWIYHRGSIHVDKIYSWFNNAKGELEIKNMRADKWNPADIWAIDSTIRYKDIPAPSATDGIQTINEYLMKQYDKGKVIGISLKKTSSSACRFDVVNADSNDMQHVTYEGPTDSTKKIQNSIVFKFKKGTKSGLMQFRSFGSTPKTNSYQGNITGFESASADAVHGKVGVWEQFVRKGITNPRLEGYDTMTKLYTASDMSKVNTKWEEERKGGNGQLWSTTFQMLYNDVNGTKHTVEEFGKMWDNAKTGYNFASNLFGLQLVKIFESNKGSMNKVFELMVLYAMSKYPGISSIHVKNT